MLQSFLRLSREFDTSVLLRSAFRLGEHTDVIVHGPGVVEFIPIKGYNKALVYSCGIHGNETAPIEICDELVEDVLAGQETVKQRVMVIFGNLEAMNSATRFIDENLNRLFCGAHSSDEAVSNSETRRAMFLEKCVEKIFCELPKDIERCHYDLHTAIRTSKNEKFAVYPFLHGRDYSRQQLQFLSACGVKTVLLSQSPTTTFSYHSSYNHQAHAFTIELGKVKPFGQNDMTRFAEARKTLRAMAFQKELVHEQDLDDVVIYRVNQVINKHASDFKLHFADDLPNFSDFSLGSVFASETGKEYRAQYEGEAIVFPNANVEIGQRALLTVVPTELPLRTNR